MYDIKALYEAQSVQDAVRLRLEHPQAQILAGGTDVLVQVREGRRAGAELISIYGLDELRGVTLDGEENIRIGSLTSFSHITRDPIIQKYINVLGQAVDMVGGPQIRNAGTIGGNTCNGVTSADSASTLLAWDAVVELTGAEGVRRLPIQDFYLSAGRVDIRPDEIQTALLVPKASYEDCFGHYIKYAMRSAMDLGNRHHRLLGECGPHPGPLRHPPLPDGLRRGRSHSPALPCRRGGGGGEAPDRGDRGDLCPGGPGGHPPPGQLAGQQGLPGAHRGGDGAAVPDRVCEAGGRCDGMSTQYKLIRCTINGKAVERMVDVRASLTDMLRNDFRLTSVKKGCEVGECGACNVIIDGECFNSCLYLAAWADGRTIRTLEGLLGPEGELSDIQQAFMDEAAIQCGFCTPGFIMTAVEILESGREYTDQELRKLLSGHLCRCTGYENILRAVKKTMLRRLGKA